MSNQNNAVNKNIVKKIFISAFTEKPVTPMEYSQ